MARKAETVPTPAAELPAIAPETMPDERPKDAQIESCLPEEGKIRLSIDLDPSVHFCFAGVARDEGMSAKDFALKLLKQGASRYTSWAILMRAWEEMRVKKRKAG